MIVALLLIALLQDGPIQTAPSSAPTSAVQAPAPTAEARPFAWGPIPSVPRNPRIQSIEDCKDATKRAPGQSEFDCASGYQAEARRAEAAAARDAPGEATTDGASRYTLFRRSAPASVDNGVPIWALTDPHRWEQVQCGSAGDDACRRQARNRLAMARAGAAAEPPAARRNPAPAQNCRMVMQRSESGFGGSLSRVCGEESASEAALDRLRETMRPVVEPCDRPADLETQDAWIARCRALPVP